MSKEGKFTGYELSKRWFEFLFETKELVTPMHTSLYIWIVELNNRLQWKEVFGLPTQYSMQASRIKSYRYYKKVLDDLIRWGFINLIRKSYNQYTCNEIALVLSAKASDKTVSKQVTKQLLHSKTIQTIQTKQTNINLFSEKVNFVFEDFLKQEEINGRNVSEARLKILIENLNSIAPDDDEYKIAVIRQAVSGNYPDFRPVPGRKPKRPDVLFSPVTDDVITTTPTEDEFIQYFDGNGYSKVSAQNAYFNFAQKGWPGDSRENWKKIVAEKCFKPKNLK